MSFKDLDFLNDILPTLSSSETRLVKKLIHVQFNGVVSKKLENLLNRLKNPKGAQFLKNEIFKSSLDVTFPFLEPGINVLYLSFS
ncbi:MAG: hypothetical protein CMP59_06645 [Flavobacteriales bacterium]|nr:hypothetical protein [Flavobacteriales bacterium]